MSDKVIINNSEGDFKSLHDGLRFKIGEQYELNEFHLKTLRSTFVNGIEYENYEYIKDDFKTLFEINLSNNIILQYNGDILCGVIYNINLKDLTSLINKLHGCFHFDRNQVLGKTCIVFCFKEFSLTLDIEKDVQLRVYKNLG